MNISLCIFSLILIYYLIIRNNEFDRGQIKKMVLFGCLLMTLESGLRHIVVGPDTCTYYDSFYSVASSSWSELFSVFWGAPEDYRDPGYAIITKAFATIIPSWQLFLIACASLYYYAMGKLLIRYLNSCTGVLLAFTLVLSLFEIIALSGMRQMITMSISMLIVPLIFERKWTVVIPSLLLSSLIHISALFVVAFIPLSFLSDKSNHKLQLVSICLFPLILAGARNIVGYMASFFANDYYLTYADKEGQATIGMYVVVALAISIYIYVMYNQISKRTEMPKLSIPAAILMTLAVPLIVLDGAMIRIGQYFTIYIMVTLSTILDVSHNRRILYVGVIAFLAYYVATKQFDYYFFWQDASLMSNAFYSHPFFGL